MSKWSHDQQKLNLFPAKGDISEYYSPRTILNQRVVDYNKECLIPFGAYVQANNEHFFKSG